MCRNVLLTGCRPCCAEVLEHAAYLGMAAMLVGKVFSEDVRNPQVSVPTIERSQTCSTANLGCGLAGLGFGCVWL